MVLEEALVPFRWETACLPSPALEVFKLATSAIIFALEASESQKKVRDEA